MKKKLFLLALGLAACIGALSSAPASAVRGCGWVCSAPGCCNYCCIDQPCALPICD